MDKWNRDRAKGQVNPSEPATRPGDFEIGSIQSRAAARAMLPKMEDRLFDRVMETLSTDQIDALIAMAEQGLDGPEQCEAYAVFEERMEELKTTGKLTAKP